MSLVGQRGTRDGQRPGTGGWTGVGLALSTFTPFPEPWWRRRLSGPGSRFYSPLMTDSEFEAKPMVLLIGQYSTGKTMVREGARARGRADGGREDGLGRRAGWAGGRVGWAGWLGGRAGWVGGLGRRAGGASR